MAVVLSALVPSACSQGAIGERVEQQSAAPDQRVADISETPQPAQSSSGSLVTYTEDRPPCANRNPWRNAFFGDLHVHTSLSLDSYAAGTRADPSDAYRFARGQPIALPPFDADGNPRTLHTIDRPLDFVAVTDHAEWFGEMSLCGLPTGDAEFCADFFATGAEALSSLYTMNFNPSPRRVEKICAAHEGCEPAARGVWARVIEAAEDAYDRTSSCEFTSFIGYEYTGLPLGVSLHRNIIFRNSHVPDNPISYVEAPTARELWSGLNTRCRDGVEGCDFITIPHNSNLSNGRLLQPVSRMVDPNPSVDPIQLATLAHDADRLMEVFQHKGSSECLNGFVGVAGAPDELCKIEQVRRFGASYELQGQIADMTEAIGGPGLRYRRGQEIISDDCREAAGDFGLFAGGCISRTDFLRTALLQGLEDEKRLGVNPLKLGVIASTDTHVATPGAVSEDDWEGHGVYESTLAERLNPDAVLPSNLRGSPGGLVGAWAIENSRDALFEALHRRETFGTSGPRITPRFFGGWGYPGDVCAAADMIQRGYEEGVPMGGDLPEQPSPELKPVFIAAAHRDPSETAGKLQKLQVVKGWIDETDTPEYRVFDVAGDSEPKTTVSLATGAVSEGGYDSLCTVWVDSEFDPSQHAYYYLRVVENPRLRWSWSQCLASPEDQRPASCDNEAPKLIHELAWSSPIWYVP